MSRFTSILVVKDDDVVQHIVCKDGRRTRKKDKPELEYKVEKKKYYDDLLDDAEDDMCRGISGLASPMVEVNDPDSLYGSDVYKFKTVKKAGQMALKAQESAVASSPQTPGSKKSRINTGSPGGGKMGSPAGLKRTPSRRSSKNVADSPASLTRTPSRRSKSGPLTPIPQRLAGPAQREHTKAEQSTPYRLRKRHVDTEVVSESDDSVDESSSEEAEEEMDTTTGGAKFGGSATKTNDGDLVASAEAYFDIHSMNPVTSDRTLSSLDIPRMDLDAIRKTLKSVKPKHGQETSKLLESHKSYFDKWMLCMSQGYNILTYGLGSKLPLLESFQQSHLKPFSHVVVNGYFPGLTVKQILSSICEEILGESKPFPSLHGQIAFIEEYFKVNDEDFFLLIHNIDGMMLRAKKCQDALSQVAAIRGVHVIASVDHINASFMWDEIQFYRFSWLWYDVTTFLSYEAENSYENSLMVQQSGGLALSSMVHVMRSLTPNAKRIFLLLSEYQLEATSRSLANYEGISFQALYQKCREEFLVNSDLTLQAQLVEFKDHRLIRAKKNFEGIEHLLIPIDRSTLKTFLDEQKENKS